MPDKLIGDQFTQLRQLLNDQKVDWSLMELRTNAIYFFRNFSEFATPEQRDDLSEAIRARLGLSPGEFAYAIGCEDPIKLEQALRPPEAEEVVIGEVLPKGGWLGDYVRFTLGHESPALFHFWNGVSTIGASLSRRVYFEKGYYRVYPNHYIVLVAPTGKCKKSTSANIAVGLLRDSNVIEILNEKGTPEGILDAMNKQVSVKATAAGGIQISNGQPALFIFAPELGVFLGKQEYNEGLILLLTSIADARPGPFDYLTRSKGKLSLDSPSVHLLGCITPDGLAHSIPQTAFLGGTISRFLFIMQSDTPRIFALPKAPDAHLAALLQTRLVRFAKLGMKVRMTAKAEEWYTEWYAKLRGEQHDTMRLSGYYERKPDHLIRLSLVLTVSEELPDELEHTVLERALKILDYTEQFMGDAFSIVDTTEQGRQYEVVVETIQRHGGKIDHSRLLKLVYRYGVNAELLQSKIVPTLAQAGVLRHIYDSTRKANYYLLMKR